MLTIRQEQAEAFRQHHLNKFEDEMVEHLRKFSPRHSKVAGEPAVRQVIRMGMEKARSYSLTNRGPVRFYIELMFMFGSYFDSDPQYPWARAVLADPESLDQSVRADRLYERTNQYLAKASGPDHCYLIEAMKRLRQAQVQDFVLPDRNLEEAVLTGLHAMYPQKCEYLGEAALAKVIRRGLEISEAYSFATEKGKILMIALTFSTGHGFPQDPLCGWIAKRLHDTRRTDPVRRAEDLHSKALLYLDHILARGDGK
jgi:hypothetical protein